MVEQTHAPRASVRSVGRQHGVNPNQLFSWRHLAAAGAYTAAAAGEEVVPVAVEARNTRWCSDGFEIA
jgi:transposase